MNSEALIRFKPSIDKLFWWILIATSILMLALTVITTLDATFMIFIMVPTDIFIAYFIISPLFGYAELREKTLFIKFGFFLKREIPYSKIRALQTERKIYADSMLSLKNSLDHVNVKYNRFDVVSLSLKDSDEFIRETEKRIQISDALT